MPSHIRGTSSACRTILTTAVLLAVLFSAAKDVAALPYMEGLTGEGWKEWFRALRGAAAFRLPAELIAVAYVARRLSGSSNLFRPEESISPIALALAACVAPVVLLQIGCALMTVAPFYAPLFTQGLTAFIRGLPATEAARAAVLSDVETPFSLHAVAVFVAYRATRPVYIGLATRSMRRVFGSIAAMRNRPADRPAFA